MLKCFLPPGFVPAASCGHVFPLLGITSTQHHSCVFYLGSGDQTRVVMLAAGTMLSITL